MAEKIIPTFQDITEAVLRSPELSRDARSLGLAKMAVVNAYTEICKCRRWSMFVDRRTLTTQASQTIGTIAYDHTGGTYERMITLTGTTWPTNVQYGKILIGDQTYSIAEQKTSTVITLESSSNPGANVASGTTYTWYRSHYPLPIDFKEMSGIFTASSRRQIELVTPEDLHRYDRWFIASPQLPRYANVRNQREFLGTVQIEFMPPPDSAYVYDYVYTRRPRDLKIEKYSTGTVSVSQDSTTVTGSGTTFPPQCVGSIIRFSSDGTNEPTPVQGSLAAVDNLMAYQRTIVTRTSATEVVVDEAIPEALSAVKYTISDPLDIDPTMFYAVLLEAQYQFAMLVNESAAKIGLRKQAAVKALRLALEDDDKTPYTQATVRYDRLDADVADVS